MRFDCCHGAHFYLWHVRLLDEYITFDKCSRPQTGRLLEHILTLVALRWSWRGCNHRSSGAKGRPCQDHICNNGATGTQLIYYRSLSVSPLCLPLSLSLTRFFSWRWRSLWLPSYNHVSILPNPLNSDGKKYISDVNCGISSLGSNKYISEHSWNEKISTCLIQRELLTKRLFIN